MNFHCFFIEPRFNTTADRSTAAPNSLFRYCLIELRRVTSISTFHIFKTIAFHFFLLLGAHDFFTSLYCGKNLFKFYSYFTNSTSSHASNFLSPTRNFIPLCCAKRYPMQSTYLSFLFSYLNRIAFFITLCEICTRNFAHSWKYFSTAFAFTLLS